MMSSVDVTYHPKFKSSDFTAILPSDLYAYPVRGSAQEPVGMSSEYLSKPADTQQDNSKIDAVHIVDYILQF